MGQTVPMLDYDEKLMVNHTITVRCYTCNVLDLVYILWQFGLNSIEPSK